MGTTISSQEKEGLDPDLCRGSQSTSLVQEKGYDYRPGV